MSPEQDRHGLCPRRAYHGFATGGSLQLCSTITQPAGAGPGRSVLQPRTRHHGRPRFALPGAGGLLTPATAPVGAVQPLPAGVPHVEF
jgi:hypothetical protein